MKTSAIKAENPKAIKVRVNSVLIAQLWKVRGVYLLFFVMLMMLGFSYYTIIQKNNIINRNNNLMYRSNDELVHGGKVFINYYYSLNAATVEYDQFRAIKMLANEEDRQARQKYLDEQDYVRKTINSGLVSIIDWRRSKVEILEVTEHYLKVKYMTFINRTNYPIVKIHVLLTLEPAVKTDDNTEGVGIHKIVNIASNPFLKD